MTRLQRMVKIVPAIVFIAALAVVIEASAFAYEAPYAASVGFASAGMAYSAPQEHQRLTGLQVDSIPWTAASNSKVCCRATRRLKVSPRLRRSVENTIGPADERILMEDTLAAIGHHQIINPGRGSELKDSRNLVEWIKDCSRVIWEKLKKIWVHDGSRPATSIEKSANPAASAFSSTGLVPDIQFSRSDRASLCMYACRHLFAHYESTDDLGKAPSRLLQNGYTTLDVQMAVR